MTTLTPVGGRGRRRNAALPVIAVGLLALLVGGLAGWYLTRDPEPSGTAAPGPSTSTCASPSASSGAKPKPLPKPASITVDVYNATERQGLAKTTAGQLEAREFVIGDVANDPENKDLAVTAEIRYGKKGKSNAVVVAAQFPDSKMVDDKRADKTVSVALGDAYDGLATPEEAAAALSPSPAASC